MKAVIIAAGKGRRIRALSKNKPKPLVKLLGLSLIERVILELKHADIQDILIIIGYKGEQIIKEIGDGEQYGVKITYLKNNDYRLANGISVLKAKELIDEPFLLLMADHMVHNEILKKLIAEPMHPKETILCVDKFPPSYIDVNEATKVYVSETGMLQDIGKTLTEYNGVDIGVFKCSPDIFKAIEQSIITEKYSLSDGIKRMVQQGRVRTLDISGHFWIDIDTHKDYQTAQRLILQNLKKFSDGPVARWFNRPISLMLTKVLVNSKITPNMISVMSFLLMLVAAGFFTLGKLWSIILGGLVAQFASILDGCDGEIARLKYLSSDFGGWFDAVLDRYGDAAIILGIVYGYWLNTNTVGIWLLGFAALIGSFMNSYTASKYDALFTQKEERMNFRMGRDVRTFLIMIMAIFNQLVYLLLVLAILTNLTVVYRIIKVRKSSKERKEKALMKEIKIVSSSILP
ncbi:MAG: sugar phosphate nucleotidyltransferase [Candidatus Heimdallarchaeaceae archaeon]